MTILSVLTGQEQKDSASRYFGISCDPRNRVPVKIQPQRAHWSRTEVLAYLEALSSSGRVLAGIDFAFAHPFADFRAYFPHHDTAPQTARELWALIDQINHGQDDFYGGGI